MAHYLIKNALVINRGSRLAADVLIADGIIAKIGSSLSHPSATIINAEGMYLMPGMIDDQVHFREPGLTAKGDIYTESRAAVAGGITSFMEMPNTIPNAVTLQVLEEKYALAAQKSLANYSFYLGGTNNNLRQLQQMDVRRICGIKVFMGSSTGNMLVDDDEALHQIFQNAPTLVATHCEDEATIKQNLHEFKNRYGDNILPAMHPLIRSARACFISSQKAVQLARQYNTRLHILHISTAVEPELFSDAPNVGEKMITAEACVHHLWFTDADYATSGNLIKWNPAIKTAADRNAVRQAVNDNRIDVIATDHAPHLLSEKQQPYLQAPSGGPLVQHALQALLQLHTQGVFSLETIVQKMAHNVAECFKIDRRGYIEEGYHADCVLVAPNTPYTVSTDSLLYKCQWSPFTNTTFSHTIAATFVSGNLVWYKNNFVDDHSGQRLLFNR